MRRPRPVYSSDTPRVGDEEGRERATADADRAVKETVDAQTGDDAAQAELSAEGMGRRMRCR
jgi:hypothetical protein